MPSASDIAAVDLCGEYIFRIDVYVIKVFYFANRNSRNPSVRMILGEENTMRRVWF